MLDPKLQITNYKLQTIYNTKITMIKTAVLIRDVCGFGHLYLWFVCPIRGGFALICILYIVIFKSATIFVLPLHITHYTLHIQTYTQARFTILSTAPILSTVSPTQCRERP